jgi:deoxyribodipyrimidine photo-lyase
MTCLIYWFRNDLRVQDNPAFARACKEATHVVPVFCHDPQASATTPWGFERVGPHRRQFLAQGLADLSAQLRAVGSELIEFQGRVQDVLPELARLLGTTRVLCETIAAPQEEAQVLALQAAGLSLESVWQSSLLDPADLPFAAVQLPELFTAFRQAVERAGVVPPAPLPYLSQVPGLPAASPEWAALVAHWRPDVPSNEPVVNEIRSSFPYHAPEFSGGEGAAMRHLARYFDRKLAHTYKATRNGLTGTDYSSKFSPWLASGALSARTAYAALKQFELEAGANDSTYWLWFELLWRDYFRFLHLKYGVQLYRERGLAHASQDLAPTQHKPGGFNRWCQGETGEPLVDAGMRELKATGYLSNRLRQVVASYLIHDLRGDWRAGAAWFESQLLDFDIYSNQGNWLYIAGRGTDPRGGRRFNPQKQTQDHDPQGHYRALWL